MKKGNKIKKTDFQEKAHRYHRYSDTATTGVVEFRGDVLLESVYSSGLNIYQCLNRLKKQLGFAKDFHFPPEVVAKVCHQYLKDKKTIRSSWAWFIKVFARESEKYHAEQNIKENNKDISIDINIKGLIKGLADKLEA